MGKRKSPMKESIRFSIYIPKNWLRILRCLVQDEAFHSVSSGIRQMIREWLTTEFGTDFEVFILNKYKGIKTPKAHMTGWKKEATTKPRIRNNIN